MIIRFSKLLLVAVSIGFFGPQVFAQEEPPMGTADSAQRAVQVLGDEVVKGNLEYAIHNMYPRLLARLIKQGGNKEDIILRMKNAGPEMIKNGISIIKFEAGPPTSFFRVWPLRKEGTDPASNDPKNFVYQWLTFVPTKSTIRMIDRANVEKRIVVREQEGFQVAITREDVDDWTFIDGSSLSVETLRSLFPSIPVDIDMLKDPLTGRKVFPKPRSSREIK